ncbi:MAG TPA: ABC transporter ATP-binding protein [Polyangiaceae bacterium]|nr:ABC transporter ATP-binding protein [Polyangiaceae bacterium]
MSQLSAVSTGEVPYGGSTPDRVRTAIDEGDLASAKRQLLALARDSEDAAAEDEALLLASRLAVAIREHETLEKDITVERNAITRSMILLLRRIEDADRDHARASAPPPSAPAPPQLSIVRDRPPDIEPFRQGHSCSVTPLEAARAAFDAQQEDGDEPLEGAVFRGRRVGKQYRRGSQRFALKDVSLTLRRGRILALAGANGSGKTTLLRIVAGDLKHSHGKIAYPELEAARDRPDWAQLRSQIGYVQQAPGAWYGRLSTTLHLTAASRGLYGKQNEREVDFWLHRLGLNRYRDARWSEISGGYKMRFELARALVRQPKLLVLDEPLAPLDIIAQRVFLQDLLDLARSKRNPLPMIVSSQHLYEIELIADEILFLRGGVAAYQGPPNEYRSKDGSNLYELGCNLSRERLTVALETLNECRVEEYGRRHLVRCPREVEAGSILGALCSSGAVVDYFHDLSRSTRRLFDERDPDG